MATKSGKPKAKAAANHRVFAFDLQKPLFKGNLLKQGEFHRAFKDRFFVLYPGFLVYYDAITTWQYDLQRGETLGSRLNAVKLRGGSVDKAKNPPRGAKNAFVVHAPDLSNKRHNYLFNAKSNEERYQWMVKIRLAIPGKANKPEAEKQQPLEEKPKDDLPLVAVAVHEPTLTAQEPAKEKSQEPEKRVPDPVEESTNTIDGSLGPRDTIKSTSSVGSIDLSSPSELSPVHKPEVIPEEADSSADKPDSQSTPIPNGDVSVVSSVTVEVNQDQKGLPTPAKTLPQSDSLDTPQEDDSLKRNSTARVNDTNETIIEVNNGSPRLSIAVANGGGQEIDSDSDSDDDSEDSEGVELPGSFKETSPEATPTSPNTNESSSPVVVPPIIIEPETSEQGGHSPSISPTENKELSSPTPDRRRPSGIHMFMEKRGYLYKQGGKHKSWHLRYFVLQPGMFTYYKNDPKGKVFGEVKLSKRTKIYMPKAGDKKYSSFQFTLYSPSAWNKRSTYAISANNEREMKDWIEAFKLASGHVIETPEQSPK